jgi:type I restriction enzyme, S subunit
MNAERLLALYERVAEAPDAIARLRRFILDLAVRGKLVPQDPNEEPASELLKRIAKEKARLVKAGEIRTREELPDLAHTAFPYPVPPRWSWCRVGHLGWTQTGTTPPKPKPEHYGDYIPFIKPADLHANHVEYTNEGLSEEGARQSGRIATPGSILMVCIGTIGKCQKIDRKCSFNQQINSLSPIAEVVSSYVLAACLSDMFQQAAWAASARTTIAILNKGKWEMLPFPLPPLAEQHRIVAKVDELMVLCDRLEAARKDREAKRDRLSAASLARLNTPDPETFTADARFTLEALPALTTRPNQIKQLRQTILNLAVRGKLVPQDPSDESVHLDVLSETEAKAALPASWRYIRLAELLGEDTRNGYSRRPDDAPGGAPILRISAGTVRRDGVVAEEEHKLISGIDAKTRKEYGLRAGDLLACRFNGNKAFVGRLSIFNDYLRLQPIYPDKLIRVRLEPQRAVSAFLRLASETDLVRDDVEVFCATTVGNWGISASNLKEVRFPVPPLAEQHRIVAKVDELMALCDRLEASLTTSDQTRTRLLEATLAEALTPASISEMEAAE